MPRLDLFPHRRSNTRGERERERFGVETGALIGQRFVQGVEGEIHQRALFATNCGDREIEVKDSPRPLRIGTLEIRGEPRGDVGNHPLHQRKDRRELRFARGAIRS